jgi:hypothetical protein
LHTNRVDAFRNAGQQQRQHVVRKAGVDAAREERGFPFRAGLFERRREVGERAGWVHQRDERARYDILSRCEDGRHVLKRFDRTQIARRRVAHGVGLRREQRLGIVRGEHAGRLIRAAKLCSVVPCLGVG